MKMKVLCVLLVYIPCVVGPPVMDKKVKPSDKGDLKEPDRSKDQLGLEYERYLKEVLGLLENDPAFKQKLEAANETDLRSNNFAMHLKLVSHGIRTKLDELKRIEVERQRTIMRAKMREAKGLGMKLDPAMFAIEHVDASNTRTFEVADLARLLHAATKDLAHIDEKRHEEFKEYEMQKEHLRRKRLERMDAAKKAAEEKKEEEQRAKHKDHPKLKHPGSKDQLEEVWEENDGLDKDDFDPKTFFILHDQNGDGVLDEEEIEALFQKELDKVYDPENSEDDMVERDEEMNRMREHVVDEMDEDGDRLVTLDEFMKAAARDSFNKDEGWKGVDDDDIFTSEEFKKFEEEYESSEAQPGVVNVPPEIPSPRGDHMDDQQRRQQQQDIQHMQQERARGDHAGQPGDAAQAVDRQAGEHRQAENMQQQQHQQPQQQQQQQQQQQGQPGHDAQQ